MSSLADDDAPAARPRRATETLRTPRDFSRALGQDYLGYLLSNGLLTLGNLLLLPLIATALNPAEIGLYGLIETAQTQGATLSMLGLKFAYLYFYAHTPAPERHRLFGTATLVTGIMGCLAGLLLWAMFSSANFLSHFDATPLPAAWLLLPLMGFGALQTMILGELRAERRVGLAGMIGVGQLAVWLIAAAILVLHFDLGIAGLLGGQCIGVAGGAIAGLIAFLRRQRFGFDIRSLMPQLRYGIPLMLGLMLRYALDSLCRFLLAAWISIEAAGQFMIAMRMTLLFEGLLMMPFFTAWGGLMHHALKSPDAPAVLSRISSLSIIAAAALVLLMLSFQPQLFTLLAHDASPGLAATFALVLLGKAVLMAKSPLTSGILKTGRTGWSIDNNLLSLGLFGLLIWPAIQYWGLAGAAAAMLAATILPTLTLARAAQRLCPQQLWREAWAMLILAAAASLALGVSGPLSPSAMLVLLAAGTITVAAGLHRVAREDRIG